MADISKIGELLGDEFVQLFHQYSFEKSESGGLRRKDGTPVAFVPDAELQHTIATLPDLLGSSFSLGALAVLMIDVGNISTAKFIVERVAQLQMAVFQKLTGASDQDLVALASGSAGIIRKLAEAASDV